MNKGEKYIKLLAVITTVFVIVRAVLNIETMSQFELRNLVIPLSRNLSFFLIVIYGLYKRLNVVRLFFSGISTLGLISCLVLTVFDGMSLDILMIVMYCIVCLFVLSNSEVKEYVMESDKPV